MADAKITELSANTDPQPADIIPMVDDPGGTPVTEKITLQNLLEVVNGFAANTDPQAADELLILDDPGGTLLGEKITLSNLLLATSDIIPAARVYHDANQSLADSTWTSLALNSERFDTDAIHDTVTNNSRLTCKTAGKYLIGGCVWFAANATGLRYVRIWEGGDTKITFVSDASPDGTAQTRMNINTVYDLAVNDYVELQCLQTSGGALNVEVQANDSPEFWMVRIGD